jgi:hypothetical protein
MTNDQFRSALAESARRVPVAPAPVAEILHAGRARRTRRRRGAIATAVCLAVLGIAVPSSLQGAHSTTAAAATTTTRPNATRSTATRVTATGPTRTMVVGKGVLDGRTWWYLLSYFPITSHYCDSRQFSNIAGPVPQLVIATPVGSTAGVSAERPAPLPSHPAVTCYAYHVGASSNGRTITDPMGYVTTLFDGNGFFFTLLGAKPVHGGTFSVYQAAIGATSVSTAAHDGARLTAPVVQVPGTNTRVFALLYPDDNQFGPSLYEYDAQGHLVVKMY